MLKISDLRYRNPFKEKVKAKTSWTKESNFFLKNNKVLKKA
jgi:hypothetical protein